MPICAFFIKSIGFKRIFVLKLPKYPGNGFEGTDQGVGIYGIGHETVDARIGPHIEDVFR